MGYEGYGLRGSQLYIIYGKTLKYEDDGETICLIKFNMICVQENQGSEIS